MNAEECRDERDVMKQVVQRGIGIRHNEGIYYEHRSISASMAAGIWEIAAQLADLNEVLSSVVGKYTDTKNRIHGYIGIGKIV